MLDSLKRVNELRELLAEARREREHTAALLASLVNHAGRMDEMTASIKHAQSEAHAMGETLTRLALRTDALDGRLQSVDTMGARLATLDGLVTSSQRTLKALEAERELAQRIEKSIKALRAGSGRSDDTKGQRTT